MIYLNMNLDFFYSNIGSSFTSGKETYSVFGLPVAVKKDVGCCEL
jgi:hypothetical protein